MFVTTKRASAWLDRASDAPNSTNTAVRPRLRRPACLYGRRRYAVRALRDARGPLHRPEAGAAGRWRSDGSAALLRPVRKPLRADAAAPVAAARAGAGRGRGRAVDQGWLPPLSRMAFGACWAHAPIHRVTLSCLVTVRKSAENRRAAAVRRDCDRSWAPAPAEQLGGSIRTAAEGARDGFDEIPVRQFASEARLVQPPTEQLLAGQPAVRPA